MVDLTPEAFRTLGYQAIDLLADHMTTLPDTPCRQPVPDDIRAALLEQPLPLEPQTSTDILERFTHLVLPYPMGNAHQRFFAWVNSPPAPLAILAELLASGMNPSVAGGDHAATYVEHTVLRWLKQLLNYPSDSGGLFTSGGSVANLIGLATMRYAKATTNTRTEGLWSEAAPMVVYTSAQGHSCIEKAVELLGIGHAYLYK
ncbi:MAG: pyridoxal-dependent decarboxylase, partial [Chloroflexota bacterium]